MGSSEPMVPIEEEIELRWTQMKVYFPPARAKKSIPVYQGRMRAILTVIPSTGGENEQLSSTSSSGHQ
jgi:hypothetical protein